MTYDEQTEEPEVHDSGSIGEQLDPEDIALGDFGSSSDEDDNSE